MKHIRHWTVLPIALSFLGIIAAGCAGRVRLTESHGRANRQAFAKQAVNTTGSGQRGPTPGLDAQDASIVVKTYRRSLSTKAGSSQDEGLVTQGATTVPQFYLPPPSVPQDRK